MSDQLIQYRDKCLATIKVGKDKYNIGNSYNEKKQGYDVFIQGIQNLVSYGKQETNEYIRKIVKEKLSEFMSEAEGMKQYLASINNQSKTMNNLNTPPQQQNQQPSPSCGNFNNNQNQSQLSAPKKKEVIKEQDKDTEKMRTALSDAIVTQKPNIKWSDVAGLEGAKKALNEAVMLPIQFPDFFQGVREPWKGILLYGPPGTGKTFLAKACASECDATFFSISSSDLMSKYVGETEKLISQLFDLARESKPAIIFIDEVDSMTGNRTEGENESSRRAKTEFLVQMQGVGKDDTGILVLGATNLPWALDPAIRRRFERRVYIPLPDFSARLWLFRNQLKSTPHTMTEQDFQQLAYSTEGYSGSDITILIRDASFQPLRKCQNAKKFKQIPDQGVLKYVPCPPSDPQGVEIPFLEIPKGQVKIPDIDIDDFEQALVNCKPSVAKEDLARYEEFTTKFGQQD